MMEPNRIALSTPLLVGIGTTSGTIMVHAFFVGTIIWLIRNGLQRGRIGHSFWVNSLVVTNFTLLALAAHLLEVALWALVFELCGEFPDFAAAFYHSAVNYTTLGYGDVLMSARWKMLGPLEAADGMLMFGISTALIFAIIQRLVQTRLGVIDG